MKVLMIANITIQPFIHDLLIQAMLKHNHEFKVHYISSDEFLTSGHLSSQYDYLIVWLHFETLFPDFYNQMIAGHIELETEIEKIYLYLKTWKQISDEIQGRLLFVSFARMDLRLNSQEIDDQMDCLISKVNHHLYKLFRNILDLNRILMKIGSNNAYDLQNYYRWNSPYQLRIYREVAMTLADFFTYSAEDLIKCVVLDCDNVLWNGILEERGYAGLHIGDVGVDRAYRDFQREMLGLHRRGIILGICSKNCLQDVMTVFEEHNGMVLKKEHIAYFAVNWENKLTNIKKVSDTLNIRLNQILFIDDSPQEIHMVNLGLPEVKTILFNRYTIFRALKKCHFLFSKDTASIKARQETYVTNQMRNELKKTSPDEETYLKSLHTKVVIKKGSLSELTRIADLSQRANRCTNGMRWNDDTLLKFYSQGLIQCHSIYVSDRFGNMGLVGAIGIKNVKRCSHLELFVLSCRVIGRKIEDEMIHWIHQTYPNLSSYTFISTNHNEAISQLLYSQFGAKQ